MPTINRGISDFLNAVSKAADIILKHIASEDVIHIVSHFDADGIAAAGIMGKSLIRLGAKVHIHIEKWIDEKVVNEISARKPPLTIFTDLGSGDMDLLERGLPDSCIVILDHHQPVRDTPSAFTHINPHIYGIDGSRDLSGSGVAYLVAKALKKSNVDLACIAIVGALGDLQDKYEHRELGGVNKLIVRDAVESGYLKVETGIMLFGRETRPIHKALACTTNPFIPGISGEEDKSLAFLTNLGITPKKGDKWRALRDLSEEEERKLFSALTEYLISRGYPSNLAMNLLGRIYILRQEAAWTPLRDAREFAVLLNATGRMDRPSLGVALCMGDRGKALDEAITILEEYRRTITKYLSWLSEEANRIEELNNIYVVHGGKYIDEKVIGTISSILSTTKPNKPIIAYSIVPEENIVKISARTVDKLAGKLNLGNILSTAAQTHSGRGGGHNVAAGAQIPLEKLQSFINFVDDLVGKSLKGESYGS